MTHSRPDTGPDDLRAMQALAQELWRLSPELVGTTLHELASLEALRPLRAAGATHAIVSCRGDAAYPVPKLLYESVGFRELSRQVALVRL